MTEPKFSVGQDVQVIVDGKIFLSCATLTARKFIEDGSTMGVCSTTGKFRGLAEGWWYKIGFDEWAREPTLRPRPEPGTKSLDELLAEISQTPMHQPIHS